MAVPAVRSMAAKFIMEIILVVICIVFAIKADNFLTWGNFLNILQSVSLLGIVAFGMTMVIIAKEIDLSVGSMVALSGCLMAWLSTTHGVPLPLAMVLTVGAGALAGAFTGFMRVTFQVPSFITTLALFTGLRGLALLLTNGFPIGNFPDWFSVLGGRVMGVPFSAIVLLVAFVGIHFLMRHTTFGSAVYAVGGNDEAARLSGIHVSRVRISVFAITSALAAVSGILTASRIGSGNPSVGTGFELDVIAAVIIGGTSFSGGIGTVWGTLIGITFIGVIMNGMTLLNVGSYPQFIIRGALILAAVVVNRLQETRR